MGALDLSYLGVTIENMCRRHYRAPWPPPVSKELLTRGPPVSKELLTGGPPVSKELLTGDLRSITSSIKICTKYVDKGRKVGKKKTEIKGKIIYRYTMMNPGNNDDYIQ